MNWIMLLWTSIVFILIVMSASAWRDMLKTETAARPHIDDISHYRHSDDDHRVDGWHVTAFGVVRVRQDTLAINVQRVGSFAKPVVQLKDPE